MKRFAWRLQRVLDIKTKEAQKKKGELLEITEKLAQTRSELLKQKIILRELIENITKVNPTKRMGIQEFFLKSSTTNDELIKKLDFKIIELEMLKKNKIAEVIKVRKFRKGLEKLRDEAKIQFIKEQEKLEQAQDDEKTTMRFARKIMHKEKAKSFN
ncbi:MAG: hypothetical protein FVQ80_05755 [Planctomycetes bacterium]|nr:hypothetical protein [Planctomycetota bacterium]